MRIANYFGHCSLTKVECTAIKIVYVGYRIINKNSNF